MMILSYQRHACPRQEATENSRSFKCERVSFPVTLKEMSYKSSTGPGEAHTNCDMSSLRLGANSWIRAASRDGAGSSSSSDEPPSPRATPWRFPLLAGAEPWEDPESEDARDPASPDEDALMEDEEEE